MLRIVLYSSAKMSNYNKDSDLFSNTILPLPPPFQCRCLLFIEETSITIDCHDSFSLTLLYKIRNQFLLQHAVTTVRDCVFLLRSLAVAKLVNEPQPSPWNPHTILCCFTIVADLVNPNCSSKLSCCSWCFSNCNSVLPILDSRWSCYVSICKIEFCQSSDGCCSR